MVILRWHGPKVPIHLCFPDHCEAIFLEPKSERSNRGSPFLLPSIKVSPTEQVIEGGFGGETVV